MAGGEYGCLSRKVIIFDLDGTLFQGHLVTVEAVRQAFADCGLTALEAETVAGLVGETMERFCARLVPGWSPAQRAVLAEKISFYEQKAIPEHGLLYTGIADMLARLKSCGYSMAICTNGGKSYVEAVLSSGKIDHIFDTVKTHDPARDKTLLVSDILRELKTEDAVVVGDRIHDFEAARANGIISIGVTYGYGGDEVKQADFCASNPVEVAGHIMRCAIFRHIMQFISFLESDRACLVGISGVDTAGKTFFAQLLERYLQRHGYHTCLIRLDDFHNPFHIRNRGPNPVDSYLGNAFNLAKLCDELLHPLKNGRPVNKELILLDLECDTFTSRKRYSINRQTVVILEGVLLYREPLDGLFDCKVFLDIGFGEVLRRAEQRDVPRFGKTILERYRSKYLPIQQKYLAENSPRERSDILIDNTDFNRPVFLSRIKGTGSDQPEVK